MNPSLFILILSLALHTTAEPNKPSNKLYWMQKIYYLPSNLDFAEGKNPDEIIPVLPSTETLGRFETPEADSVKTLSSALDKRIESLTSKSLLEQNKTNKTDVKVSQHLFHHSLEIQSSASKNFKLLNFINSLPAQLTLNQKYQRALLHTWIPTETTSWNHLFIVSPSWCKSSQYYRVLLEDFFKKFKFETFALHSVIIEDPKEFYFKSPIQNELFPNKELYSHSNTPQFIYVIGTKKQDEAPRILEEGGALQQFYSEALEKKQAFDQENLPRATLRIKKQ